MSVSVHGDPTFLPNDSSNPLESLSLKITGGTGGGGDLTPDVDGNASLDVGTLPAGMYTATVAATYENGSSTIEVDSAPVTFYVASFTVKAGSWNPNPNCVGEISSGQAQAAFDPSSIDGKGSGPFFVIYTWTTQNVYYSQDGTSGAFEPYGGNCIVEWQQGQANTTFQAQCSDVGFYILEAQCVATVYSQSTGAAVAVFTQTCYIGGSAGDIDQSGGSGHAQKAHGLKSQKVYHFQAHVAVAHDGGGGTGHQEAPATVTFSPNSQIKLGLGAPTGNKTTITATVSPADKAGTVTFSATDADFTTPNGEVTISPSTSPSTPNASGQITLTITAASATPVTPGNSSSPDCFVIASSGLGTTPLAKVPVLVLKPTSVEESSGGSTKYVKNAVYTSKSDIPGDWKISDPPSSQVLFASFVFVNITITIYDQFGAALDSMYDGHSVVDEQFLDSVNGNSAIKAIAYPTGKLSHGVITDEVGIARDQPVDINDAGMDIDKEESDWMGYKYYFNGWDNLIAALLGGTPPLVLDQVISVYSTPLPQVWIRTITYYQQNHEAGTIEKVTEQLKQ